MLNLDYIPPPVFNKYPFSDENIDKDLWKLLVVNWTYGATEDFRNIIFSEIAANNKRRAVIKTMIEAE